MPAQSITPCCMEGCVLPSRPDAACPWMTKEPVYRQPRANWPRCSAQRSRPRSLLLSLWPSVGAGRRRNRRRSALCGFGAWSPPLYCVGQGDWGWDVREWREGVRGHWCRPESPRARPAPVTPLPSGVPRRYPRARVSLLSSENAPASLIAFRWRSSGHKRQHATTLSAESAARASPAR